MQYTDEVKAEALELLETEDIWAACRATGANHSTIYRWHAAHVRTLQKQDPDLAASEEAENRILRTRYQRRLLQIAMAHADRSDASEDANAALRFMTAGAIAHDKYRLEMGESTGRTETVTLGFMESEVQRLEAELGKRAPVDT